MSTKEQIVHELNNLNQADLEQIAQYLTFIKYKVRIKPAPTMDEAQLAALYSQFGEEDRQLAEEGMSDFADVVAKEDHK